MLSFVKSFYHLLFHCSFTCFIGAAFIVGCATTPSGFRKSDKTTGHWEGKALVRDFKHEKSYNLSVDFEAKDRGTLRAEVTATLGIAVASLVVRPDGFQMLVYNKKTFYQGTNNSRSLEQSMGMPIDPKDLLRALFDEPLPASDFACDHDADGLPGICRSKSSDLVVQWTERSGELKRIVIQRKDAEMQILIKDFSTKVRTDNDFYTLKAPDNYKIISLN